MSTVTPHQGAEVGREQDTRGAHVTIRVAGSVKQAVTVQGLSVGMLADRLTGRQE